MIKNLLIKIEYDGTHYKGWQVQPNQITVESEIKSVFERICQQEVVLSATSRTDSGVHARGQVATLKVPASIPLKKLFNSVNALLPNDIAISDLVQVDLDYSARADCSGKRYIYRITNAPIQRALNNSMSLWVKGPLDFELMREAIKSFEGTYDFKAFQGKGCQQVNTIKTITRTFGVYERDGYFSTATFTIEGSGFLKNMIRIIMGTLLEIGRHKRDKREIKTIIESRRRERAGITAPAKGLTLDEVFLRTDPFSQRNGPTWDNENL